MSDIRLKRITVEPNNILEIQRGQVKITDTTVSSSTTASIMLNGGLSINKINNSTNHTSGGALTIAGGVGISKDVYINGSQINENPMSILSIAGGSVDRLSIKSIIDKHISMSVDGIDNQIDIFTNTININTTTQSTNASSGALVVNGGVSAKQLHIETTSLFKGSARINDELVVKDIVKIESGVIVLEHSSTTNSVIYNTGGDINILNESGDINLASGDTSIINLNDNIHVGNNITNIYKDVVFNNTKDSISIDNAGIIISSGISIKNTSDATSSTRGGNLTLAGGIGVAKNIYAGERLNMIDSTVSNKIHFYNTSSGIGNTGVNLLINSGSTISNIIFRTNRDILEVSGNSDILFHGDATQTYRANVDNKEFYIQGRSAADTSTLGLYTNDGDSNDDVNIRIYKRGLPKMRVTSEYLESGWNTSSSQFEINVSKTGVGEKQRLAINSDRMIFETNGNNIINGLLDINNSTHIKEAIEVDRDGYIHGQLVITNTTVSDILSNGSLIVSGDISTGGKILSKNGVRIYNDDTFGNTRNAIIASRNGSYDQFEYLTDALNSDIKSLIYSKNNLDNYNNELKIYTYGNPTESSTEFIQISNKNSDVHTLLSNRSGSGRFRDLNLKAGASQIHMGTSGNIGINTTSANYTLEIVGNMSVDGKFEISDNLVNTISRVRIMHTEGSVNLTSGSLVIVGGMSVGGEINATSPTSGGGLTVAGGVGISKDILIGGVISTYSENYNTMKRLKILSTDVSLSSSSGSVISFGGISIMATANSVSANNGGGLTVAGGIGVSRDAWISGDVNFGSEMNMYSTSGELINFYDQFNIKRFIISGGNDDFKIKTTNNIGEPIEDTFVIDKSSRYVQLKNTTGSIDASTASLIMTGGVSINTTMNATSSTSGGGISIAGGLGVAKDVYISGITRFVNTDDTFNLGSGSVILEGGAVIKKSLNIGGDIIISGDLTVNGKTTSIESTVVDIKDNIIKLNSGPQGTKDSGISIHRYQMDNDNAEGDVVNDIIAESVTLQDQTGISNIQVRLPSSVSSLDGFYNGYWIKVGSGFAVRQVRQIISYDGMTKIATISTEWNGINPSIGDILHLYNRYYVGLAFNEVSDRFRFGATSLEPQTSGSLELTTLLAVDMLDLVVEKNTTTDTLIVESTNNSTNISSGSVIINGGASISRDVRIYSHLYVKDNDITPSADDIIRPRIYDIENGMLEFVEIPDINFSNSWGVDIYLTSRVITDTRVYYTNYHIRGVSKNGEWDVVKTYVGDAINIDFSISTDENLMYSTPDIINFASGQFKIRCITV